MLSACLVAAAARAEPTAVEAEGRAAGDSATAREQALTDALREAVRKGVGVDVTSATRVTDFAMDYDRVFAAAFGHVKQYTVLEAGLDKDGIYRVKIRALVEAGQPVMKDALTLRMIVQLKGAPRVALETDELIEGVPPGSDYAKAWFEAVAREMQLALMDTPRASRQSDKLAARDAFLGDAHTAELRRLDMAPDAEFVVQARVRGRYVGRESLYGMTPRHKFSLAVDLRAVRPETGEVLASVPIPAREDLSSELQSPEMAARELTHMLLAGDVAHSETPCAWSVFRKVFARWLVELDLGAIRRLEFAGVTDAEFDALQKALGETPAITSVWPREFDSRGLSFIDVESRFDPAGLKTIVAKALTDALVYDRGTEHYLQFKRKEMPGSDGGDGLLASAAGSNQSGRATIVSGVESSHSGVQPPEIGKAKAMPVWAWWTIGTGGALAMAGVFLMGRRIQ
ncbi:MAG: hypothetical protein HY343_12750 [Lentisphaerae bacterium]|nr:hypothetical protein [Lentisphaerota bacterium]